LAFHRLALAGCQATIARDRSSEAANRLRPGAK
jgi:hypothetical protein